MRIIIGARTLMHKFAAWAMVAASGGNKPVLNKLRNIMLMIAAWMTVVSPAWAVGGIAEQTAEQTSAALVNVVKDIIQPIGAFIIFIVVAWTAFSLITTAHRPEERARVMGSIPYILGGGIALGAVLIIAGFIVGLMVKAGGAS